jgi:predicted transcriptional regulator
MSRSLIMSIRPSWASLIKVGTKTVELRRRFPEKLAGSFAYVYESSATCHIGFGFDIRRVVTLPVAELLQIYGTAACVEEASFWSYFARAGKGVGIEVGNISILQASWNLKTLRERFSFTAPQSWRYASSALTSSVEFKQ